MISKRLQTYIEDHSFCSEFLFKDWDAFLDFLYEEGGRVSSILWWDHCKKNEQHESCGSGGYSNPDEPEWMYAETWLHEDGFEEKSLEDIKAYIRERREHGLILGDKYISHDLVPSFYLADNQSQNADDKSMKEVILSADGDSFLYLVPDIVADHLEEYCLKFCSDWLWNSPDAEKYRVGSAVCYTEADFIEYLNNHAFPDCESKMIKNIGWTDLGANLPEEYKEHPYYNF